MFASIHFSLLMRNFSRMYPFQQTFLYSQYLSSFLRSLHFILNFPLHFSTICLFLYPQFSRADHFQTNKCLLFCYLEFLTICINFIYGNLILNEKKRDFNTFYVYLSNIIQEVTTRLVFSPLQKIL